MKKGLKTHHEENSKCVKCVIPSHYFDRVLFWHYVVQPCLDVGKLVQQLIFDSFDH